LSTFWKGVKERRLLCGAGCAGAHDAVVALRSQTQGARRACAACKEHIEGEQSLRGWGDGLIGIFLRVHAMEACAPLMLGTDFPYRQFYTTKARIAQIDNSRREPRAALPARSRRDWGRARSPIATDRTSVSELDDSQTKAASQPLRPKPGSLDDLPTSFAFSKQTIHPQLVAK